MKFLLLPFRARRIQRNFGAAARQRPALAFAKGQYTLSCKKMQLSVPTNPNVPAESPHRQENFSLLPGKRVCYKATHLQDTCLISSETAPQIALPAIWGANHSPVFQRNLFAAEPVLSGLTGLTHRIPLRQQLQQLVLQPGYESPRRTLLQFLQHRMHLPLITF